VESRITEDKAMKKVVDEIVAVLQNGKYHACPLFDPLFFPEETGKG